MTPEQQLKFEEYLKKNNENKASYSISDDPEVNYELHRHIISAKLDAWLDWADLPEDEKQVYQYEVDDLRNNGEL